MSIKFYSTKGKYGCFTNFSRHKISLDDKLWPTTEHYYQAQKFITIDPDYSEKIRLSKKPRDAFNLGQTHEIRVDWNKVKDDYMRLAVITKFYFHDNIQKILLSTGKETLIEDSPVDYYWGCGKDGTGKNMLGKVLMEVRGVIKEELSLANYMHKLNSPYTDEDILSNINSPVMDYFNSCSERIKKTL